MKIRLPIALAIAPAGFLVGALIVGRPVSVPNDLVLDPDPPSVTVTVPTAPDPASDTVVDDDAAGAG